MRNIPKYPAKNFAAMVFVASALGAGLSLADNPEVEPRPASAERPDALNFDFGLAQCVDQLMQDVILVSRADNINEERVEKVAIDACVSAGNDPRLAELRFISPTTTTTQLS